MSRDSETNSQMDDSSRLPRIWGTGKCRALIKGPLLNSVRLNHHLVIGVLGDIVLG